MKLIDLLKEEYVGKIIISPSSKELYVKSMVPTSYYLEVVDKTFLNEEERMITKFNYHAWTSDDWKVKEEPMPKLKHSFRCLDHLKELILSRK